jgi:hypothetical protein
LLRDGAFDEVVRDAHFVFHTASPFFIKAEKDAQKELIDPALKGTQVRLPQRCSHRTCVEGCNLLLDVAPSPRPCLLGISTAHVKSGAV